MEKLLREYGFLFAFILLSGVTSGQESFEGWVSEDQALISRSEGTHRSEILLDLSKNNKEHERRSEEPFRSGYMEPMALPDGSLVQLLGHDLYLIKADGEKFQLTDDDSEEKNAQLSPDKTKVAYTKDHNLYMYDLSQHTEKQLTSDGSESVYNGWASWVYYEEILGRSSHYSAFWWSPDNEKIAFLHFDDAPVPTFPIFHSDGQHGSLEVDHYPKAGDPNPDVQFAIADVSSGKITWVSEDPDKDQYSALPFWSPQGKHLLIQELNRGQDTLRLVRINPQDGSRKLIYEEIQPTWVEFFEDLKFIDDQEFIIRSNRKGWYNLYRYDIEGHLLAAVTPVNWRVTEIDFIDRDKGDIYFYGTGSNSTERHFFRAKMDGTDLRQITTEPGWHQINPSPGNKYFFDEYSALNTPPQQIILDNNGQIKYQLKQEESDQNKKSGVKVEALTIHTEDGFDLPGYWVLPKEFSPAKKYAVVFDIYGGPDAGTVRNRYHDFSGDFYSNQDIIRMVVDHRGSGKFGKKGMDFMHRSLGKWEIDDLISAVKWLRTLPYIDSTRIAITGGSYGGYLTAMALTYGADYFTHGISLFPVTDWQLYDNVYTERYMDTPAENPDGYKFGSAIEQAYKLKGKLLIVHGMVDDNVHMQNTVQFISRLQDLGKDFELMMYPGERHGWGGAKRSHLSRLINDFWMKNLVINPDQKLTQP